MREVALTRADRPRLAGLLARVAEFNDAERRVALELVDAAIADPEGAGYRFVLEDGGDACEGYACFGATPMTVHSWDLYWIAVAPEARGRRLGVALLAAVEESVAGRGGRLVRVETSSRAPYAAAIRLYDRSGYERVGRIADFYADGDDLITFAKRLAAPER